MDVQTIDNGTDKFITLGEFNAQKNKPFDLTNAIIDFENGDLEDNDVLVLFSRLKQTGLLHQLQGSYGRNFDTLVRCGNLDGDGNILKTF